MLFLKKHGWWLVSIVVGLCVSVLILSRSSDPPVETEAVVPSGAALRSPQSMPSASVPRVVEPPPPGEIEGTGHWEGNTWHKTDPPEPEWEAGSDDDLYSMALRDGYLRPWEVKEALRYHPESPLLLSMFAVNEVFHRPEETILYAKKALRNLAKTSEDYSKFGVTDSPRMNAHWALGFAYQKLGDYKTALVHLKMTRSLLKPGLALDSLDGNLSRMLYEGRSRDIAAIKAGKPLLGPDPKPAAAAAPLVVSDPSPSSSDSVIVPPVPVDMGAVPSRFPAGAAVSSTDPSFVDARGLRAESEAFREDPDRLRARQEHLDFVRWLETIESAKSPSDLDTFLMREMAKTLSGGDAQFTPDRLIRAFEVMHRQGQPRGLSELEKRDAEIAREVARQDRSRHVPPRANRQPK